MKKVKTVKQTVKRKETIEITCDFCGKTISGEEVLFGDITSFSISPGYGSKFDNETFEFDICDKCLEKHFLKKINNEQSI